MIELVTIAMFGDSQSPLYLAYTSLAGPPASDSIPLGLRS
jgi:hypothetical protein